MGAYLSSPITDKHSDDGELGVLRYGVSEMQGWRKGMEDAHITQLKMETDDNCLLAVFDGHGGKEVALFCREHFARELQAMKEYQTGDYPQALRNCFHRMDEMLRQPAYAAELLQFQMGAEGAAARRASEVVDDPETQEGAESMQAAFKAQMDAAEAKGTLTRDEALGLMLKMFKLRKLEKKGGEDDSVAAGQGIREICDAGCTAVVALLSGTDLFVANAGDSRAICCSKGEAHALSHDHKPNDETETRRIMAAGGFVNVMGRVNGNLNLSRSIGDLRYKDRAELPREDQVITAEPDVVHHEVTADDEFVVLACDGIWDVYSNQQVVDFVRPKLAAGEKISTIVEELLDNGITKNPTATQGLGGDNMTCIILALKSTADLAKAMEEYPTTSSRASVTTVRSGSSG